MSIKYVPYNPAILQGQAVLPFFRRTQKLLAYRGDDEIEPHINRGMPLYETRLMERVGDSRDGNLMIRGECLSACAYLKDKGISVDLVYIDPPFASGANYAKTVYLRRNPKVAEAIAEATKKAQLDNADMQKFEAEMYGDIWNKECYLSWMYENLMAIKSIMSPTASIYVHLDWHIGHYVKILMDEIFGEDNFKNEIIWAYRIQGISKGTWPKKHDTIFLYSLNPDNVFHPEKETIIYEKPFIDTVCTPPDMSNLTERQKKTVIDSVERGIPLKDNVKKYLFNTYSTEVYVRDVWDCDSTKPLISGSSEYVDYKTQKPEGLLKRIIEASSNEGQVVADFFGGSGVTAAVASKTNRRFIHVDVNSNSITTARDRLVKDGARFEVLEIQDGVSLFRNPVQTMKVLPSLIQGLVPDRSISSYWSGVINDSKYGKMPVYIPDLLSGAEARVVSDKTMHKLIYEELSQLEGVKKVIFYYIDIDNRKQIDAYIAQHNTTLIEIDFRDLKIILDNLVAQDEAEFSVKESNDGVLSKWEVEVISFVSDRVKRKIDDYNYKAALNARGEHQPVLLSESGLEAVEWISLDCVSADLNAEWTSSEEIRIEPDSYITINGISTRNFWDGKIQSNDRPLRVKIRNICGDESVFILQ